MLHKRLERGTFAWPLPANSEAKQVELSSSDLAALLGGLDLGFIPGEGGKTAGGGGGSGGGPQTSGSDDDIVARRLRKAAEEETDPELKERLWKEYNEYKKSAK